MSSAVNKKRKRSSNNSSTPRILGSDGKFHLERDAMGVPGFSVAVNCFTPDVHRRLFAEATFDISPQPFVEQQDVPIKQTVLHPTMPSLNGSWPDNWHRIINAVRDCGLFEQATIPDCGYGLTYDPGSTFPCHWDGRGKWGEYVIVATLGAPCTVTFQHAPPKGKPIDPSRSWDWTPPDPADVVDDPHWTRSRTEEEVELDSWGKNKRHLWQLTMTLPPNSLYVMSGPSRYDWRHGINCDEKHHPVPTPASSYITASGSITQVPANNQWLFPSWNKSGSRRAVIYRSTKCFSDLCLRQEKEKALDEGDYDGIIEVNRRIGAANRFPPQDQYAQRKLTEKEIEQEDKKGMALMEELKRSGAHRLRFAKSEVMFSSDNMTRASGDIDAPTLAQNEKSVTGREEAKEGEEKQDEKMASADGANEAVAFTGQGRRLGQSGEHKASKAAEIIELLDSDDEQDDEKEKTNITTSSSSSTQIKKEVKSAEDSAIRRNEATRNAGLAALKRFEAFKNSKEDAAEASASASAASFASSSSVQATSKQPPLKEEEPSGNRDVEWECSICTLLNKPMALQCDACGTERCANDGVALTAPTASSAAAAPVLNQNTISSALANAFADSSGLPAQSQALAPGHAGSLRNKHAYLHNSNSGDGIKRQKLPDDNDEQCYMMGSMLIDKNRSAYSSGGWIWAHCPNFAELHPGKSRVDKESDIVSYQNEFRSTCNNTLSASKTQEYILDLAKKHNVLHGKWLLAVKAESATKIWPKIRNACIAGKLGSTVKISDSPGRDGTSVICAYTNNFTDKEDVLRVRKAIHELGIFTKLALHYKPDAIALLDVYSGDTRHKGMKTTIFACGGPATKERLEDYGCECLVSSYKKCTRQPGCPRCYPKCKA